MLKIHSNFGQIIAEERCKRFPDFNLMEFSRMTAIPRTTLENVEKHNSFNPSFALVATVAEAFDVPLEEVKHWFVHGERSPDYRLK